MRTDNLFYILVLLPGVRAARSTGYLGPSQLPRFMSPQRPGNENFPANQVVAPVAQEVGLQYQPWFGTDDDDLEYPTINVHYDFEPKDWNRKKDELRDRIALRRERNKFLANVAQDETNLQEVMERHNSQLQEMTAALVQQGVEAKEKAAGGTARKLPEALRTGTALGTSAMSALQERLDSLYPEPLDKLKSFAGSHIRSYSAAPDIFEHLADAFAAM